jgi:predicted metal-dependent hydrolase
MSVCIRLGEVSISLTRKPIKHVHLAVHPPAGRVTMVAPMGTRTEVARAFAITKLGWIRQQQSRFHGQAREAPRRYIERETHDLWGRPRLLHVLYKDQGPSVVADHLHITLTVRPGSDVAKRAEVMYAWHREQLHHAVPALIRRWEPRLKVKVNGYFLQRMKTKWGSCNTRARRIRLNTELVKKPKDLLEYVIVHEMLHILEPKHSERFFTLIDQHYPRWREAQAELNELPLAAETWQR